MKRTLGVTAIVLGVLAGAGCTGAPATDTGKTPDPAPVATVDPSVDVVAEDEEPAESEAEYGAQVFSSRGNLVKEIGQLAGVTDEDDVTLARFVVTDIVLDPTCDREWADKPENGHYLALHLNVETTPELADADYPEIWISEYDWQVFDADGKRLNDPQGNAYTCFSDGKTLPSSIGPGQSVSGYIVLDVASTSGFAMFAMGGSPIGWEWAY